MSLQRLVVAGKEVKDNDTVCHSSPTSKLSGHHHRHHVVMVVLLLRLVGGKGGFGSLLRAASTKVGQKKTSNFAACRDLSGRRLRHVDSEQQLLAWQELQQRRKAERESGIPLPPKPVVQGSRGRRGGGGGGGGGSGIDAIEFDDVPMTAQELAEEYKNIKEGRYVEKRMCKFKEKCKYQWKCRFRHPGDEVKEPEIDIDRKLSSNLTTLDDIVKERDFSAEVKSAVNAGLMAALFKKKQQKQQRVLNGNGIAINGSSHKRKASEIEGDDDEKHLNGGESKSAGADGGGDDADLDLDLDLDLFAVPMPPKKRKIDVPVSSSSLLSSGDSSRSVWGATNASLRKALSIASPHSPPHGPMLAPVLPSSSSSSSSSSASAAASETKSVAVVPVVPVANSPSSSPVAVVAAAAPTTAAPVVAVESSSPSSSSSSSSGFAPIDLSSVASAQSLHAYGLEHLKHELTRVGLKCGGTLAERAERLFLLKSTPYERLPNKVKAVVKS